MMAHPLLALLLLAGPSGPAAAFDPAPSSQETKDRLSEARLEALVAYPIALVRRGEVEAGEAAFEKLLRFRAAKHGPGGSDQADLLTAFGILLFTHFQLDESLARRRRAVPYLRRAVDAYREAFGDRHRETALALNSYADALIESHKEPPREADAALEEALAIRMEALGPDHVETVAGLATLAALKTRPSRIRKDVEATAALLRRLLELVPVEGVDSELGDPLGVRVRLAELYIANRRIPDALEVVEEARRRGHGLCRTFGPFSPLRAQSLSEEVARLLDEAGHRAQANLLAVQHRSVCGPARSGDEGQAS